MRDIFEIIDIYHEEKNIQQEQNKEFLGELLASIHNNGYPYEGKKAMERKDFIRLSYDEIEEENDPQDLQEMMRTAHEALNKLMNIENE